MTDEWLNEIEGFGQRRERLHDEIEHMDFNAQAVYAMVIRWAEGAIQYERLRLANSIAYSSRPLVAIRARNAGRGE